MIRRLLVALLLLSNAVYANNVSTTCAGLQAAINSAADGDTVTVTGGTCNSITVPAKAITIDGSGTTTLNGTSSWTLGSSGTARVTRFRFPGSGTNARAWYINGSKTTSTFRLDHNTFTSTSQAIFVEVAGNPKGLIDNNSFTGGQASEMIHNMGIGAGNTAGWADDVVPGSAEMLFVEDNNFTFPASGNPAYFWGSSALQAYYGSRTVFRHNIMNMVQVDQHGTATMVGARWYEIYNNQFNTVANANQSNYMALRAGSGVVYNNTQTGPNLGGGVIELVEEDSGYPALYQIGRGINQNLSPLYLWGNGASLHIQQNSSNVQVNRDYFVSTTQPATMMRRQLGSDTASTTYSYTPYPYPHPLQGGVMPPPPLAPPTNLTVIVN